MCYSVMTQAYQKKEIPSSPNRSWNKEVFDADFSCGIPTEVCHIAMYSSLG